MNTWMSSATFALCLFHSLSLCHSLVSKFIKGDLKVSHRDMMILHPEYFGVYLLRTRIFSYNVGPT